MNKVTILGATGSIGTSTLDVIRRNPELYSLYAVTANANAERMYDIITEFQPVVAVVTNKEAYDKLIERLQFTNIKTQVLFGSDNLAMVAACSETDSVVSAIVGAAGLRPTLAAVLAGKTIYLANKESLVMSGNIIVEAAHRSKATIVPVDSEHNAIFQCLPLQEQQRIGQCHLKEAGIRKLLLTGSGGPFRELPLDQFANIKVADALHHPNWSMGRKITIDSATMMNKGLEFIEAKWLFNADPQDIEVIIHPQSVVHSMVQYIDGSVLAQLGKPDMRTPIARALAWPQRIESGVADLDFFALSNLTFLKPDYQRYPCLKLAIDALNVSQAMTTAVNAANEIAVAAFLSEQIRFTDIYTVCAKVAEQFVLANDKNIEAILAVDMQARAKAYTEVSFLQK